MDSDKALEILVKLGVIGEKDVDRAKQGLADFAKQAGHTGEDIGATEVKTRELHVAMSKLNQIVPGAGEALKLAFHPDEVGIIGLIVGFEALKTVLENIQSISEIKLANFTGTKEEVDAVRESYEKMEVSARMFVEDLIRANAAGATAEEIAKRQIQNYKNLAAAQADYNTAQKSLGEAEIDANERNGVITHQQALQQKFALDVEYSKQKLALEAATDAQELAAKRQQLATEQRQLAAAQGDKVTDEANAAGAAAAKVKHDREKDDAKKNIDDAQKTLDELGKSHGSIIEGIVNDDTVQQLKEYYQKYVGGDTEKTNLSDQFLQLQEKMKTLTNPASWDLGLTSFMDRTIGSQTGPEELAKYQGAKQQQEAAQKQLRALEDSQFKVDLNAERGKKQLDATEDSIKSLSKSVNELASQLPQIAADSAAKIANAAGVQNLDLRADAINKGLPDPGNIFRAPSAPVATTSTPQQPRGTEGQSGRVPYDQTPDGQMQRDYRQFSAGFDTLRAGGTLNANQTEMMQHIAEMIAGHQVQSNELLSFMRTVFASQQSVNDSFRREVDMLKQQVANAANHGMHQ